MNQIKPSEILDPYPERSTSLGGVRQTTALVAKSPRESTVPTSRNRRRRPFGASLLLTIAAQGVLSAAIAAQQLNPLIGAAGAVGLLVCGLTLIAAEVICGADR